MAIPSINKQLQLMNLQVSVTRDTSTFGPVDPRKLDGILFADKAERTEFENWLDPDDDIITQFAEYRHLKRLMIRGLYEINENLFVLEEKRIRRRKELHAYRTIIGTSVFVLIGKAVFQFGKWMVGLKSN